MERVRRLTDCIFDGNCAGILATSNDDLLGAASDGVSARTWGL